MTTDSPPPSARTKDYACPKCGAEPGQSCREPGGRKRWFHKERAKAAYRAADIYNPIYNPHGSRIPDMYRSDR